MNRITIPITPNGIFELGEMDHCMVMNHAISIKRIAARGEIISCGIMNASASAFIGLGRLDFTRLSTTYRYNTLLQQLEELISCVEQLDFAKEESPEIPDLLDKITGSMDIVLAADTAPFHFPHKEETTKRLVQLRDKLFALKAKVALIRECRTYYELDQDIAKEWEYADSEI